MEEITLKNLSTFINQAYQLRKNKQMEEAFNIAQQCLNQFPNRPDVLCLYGILQVDRKKYFEAEKAFNTAITLEPEKADPYFYLGELLRETRRFVDAEKAYLQCLKLNKRHVLANFQLGVLYELQNRNLDAIRAFKNALDIDPNVYQASSYLAIIYHKQNRLENAITMYLNALEKAPNDISILSNLGAALTRDRQFQRAIPYYEKALEISPDYVAAITNLGGTYIEMNKLDKGQEYMRRALALDPNLPANWRNLTLCTKFDPNNTKDLNMIQLLMEKAERSEKSKLSDDDRIHYYFALGKIYDDYKEYDKAFNYYKLGNDLQAKRSVFIPDAFGSHISRIIKINDEVTINPLPFDKEKAIIPIIIMGTARAGKTLLEEFLLQCPEIGGVGELGISDIAAKLPLEIRPKTNYPYWLKTITEELAIAIRDEYLSRLQRTLQPGQRFIIDTMPGNYLYLGLINALLPNAKFIHCQRNPMDACLLMYFKFFIEGHGYSYDLARLGRYYKQYLRMMDYWREKLPNPIFDVDYEALIENAQATLTSVMDFLQADLSFQFDVSKLYKEEIAHWQHYKKYLGPLKEGLAEEVSSVEEKDEKAAELTDLMGSAYLSYEQGDTVTAEIMCRSLLEAEPEHYSALHIMGIIYAQRGNFDQAIDYLEKAVKISPNNVQLHLDLSRAYKDLGKQMQSEHHLKMAEMLQESRSKNQIVILDNVQRNELYSAFSFTPQIIDEYETRMLLEGKISYDMKTDSYMTRSWDQYFTDLSFGSFRTVLSGGRRPWRMRTWHFLYKNMSLVDNILNQVKPKIRILDIGCSTGYLRRFLEGNIDPKDNKKIYYWGLDIRKDVLEDAVKSVDDIESGASGNLVPSAFIVHDIKHGLPFKDSFFDYVINFEMIKYLPVDQGKKLLAEIYRVLSPKGLLYLSTSYSTDQPGFIQSTPYEQLEEIIRKNGFEVIAKRGSQSSIQALISRIKEQHQPLVKDLLAVHPPEIVAAMITPLYPQYADQVTFICRIKE